MATEKQVGADNGADNNTNKKVYTLDSDGTQQITLFSMNKIANRDLNNNRNRITFTRYSKDDIQKFLSDPAAYEKELRKAIIYIYGASPHFKRVIDYFSSLTDLSFVVSPFKIDPSKAKKETINKNYRKVLNLLSSANIKSQFKNIVTVCLREDVYYGTLWITNDDITIQQLPSDYCAISSIEGNVPNVTFDFSYFDSHGDLLQYYPEEFTKKYNQYKAPKGQKWIELDSPTSFAVKCNRDILDYAVPPLAGILREVYDIEDYRQLKMTKTELENYALLVMTLPMDSNGDLQLEYGKAKGFWENLDYVLPEEVGSVLSPMPITKIGFDKSNAQDADAIEEAEHNLFTAAGVSSLLFNNEKASANALSLSISADQALTFRVVLGIQDVLNRYLQTVSYGKNFTVTFLDVSPFNRKTAGDLYLRACQFGIPMVSYYAASQGLGQAELDSMNFLENEVLDIKSNFIPLLSSTNSSSKDLSRGTSISEGGRPQKDDTDLSESGEQSRADGSDW